MILFAVIFIVFMTMIGLIYTFGGKNLGDRNNGAKITAAGLVALAILVAFAA